MPHKRSKRSLREKERDARGFELAPSSAARKSELDDIPKSMRRVLDGERIQKEWRDKKRKREESGDKGDDEGRGAKKAKSIEIKPEESLKHFNQRVEDDMRGTMRQVRIKSKKIKPPENPPSKSKQSSSSAAGIASDTPDTQPLPVAKEFASRPKTTRLNDIAQAPPTLTHKPRKAQNAQNFKKTDGLVSLAQKQMMEAERETAIERYRELRERQRAGNPAHAHMEAGVSWYLSLPDACVIHTDFWYRDDMWSCSLFDFDDDGQG
ncbi:hypothetical protein SISSUDRAFT_1065655 [Sistotremastrum suecicum HHB10207 ss-3]|uniref:Uncharacterized protein n=1 Tax=Sistotremastrum suecicum HHB10207 ss-3 TaxID=1314776 RepID=A0A165Z7R9_9AGAM|nr:hypothetical protein SISSUDRAFT_1065655 [Sistotremastrum suecicum HHB10207 ss-3]